MFACMHDTFSNDFDKRKKGKCYIANEFLYFWVHKSCSRLVFLGWFEVSYANALRYCSLMSHLHHIIVIFTNLLSKVTCNTFIGEFTLDLLLAKLKLT